MFFQNKAMPNYVVMLDPAKIKNANELKEYIRLWKKQYKGTANS